MLSCQISKDSSEPKGFGSQTLNADAVPRLKCWNMDKQNHWLDKGNADPLTHWGRMMHICVNNVTIIGSDNGLSPGRRRAIIWTNTGILLIGPLGTNFSEIWSEICIFSFTKMHLKMPSAKWRPFCLGLNALIKKVIVCNRWLGSRSKSIKTRQLCPRYYTQALGTTTVVPQLMKPIKICDISILWIGVPSSKRNLWYRSTQTVVP